MWNIKFINKDIKIRVKLIKNNNKNMMFYYNIDKKFGFKKKEKLKTFYIIN